MTTTRILKAALCALPFAASSAIAAGVPHDPAHDFDFDFGTWKTHAERLVHPLSGSREWSSMDGTTVVKPVWGGRANLAELTTDGPTGRLELLAWRLYNPVARQWSINFATSGVGILNVANGVTSVPIIGAFKDGKGVFYDQEDFNGRAIWVRFTIYPVSATVSHSEQAFSDDNGKTWETNWRTTYTKL